MSAILRFIPRSVLVLGLLACVCGCSIGNDNLTRYEYTQIIMGVEARIVLYTQDQSQARAAARAGFDRMTQLDDVMSDYKDHSELMSVCRASSGEPIPVSADLFAVLDIATHVAKASGGAFDITAGPAVQLWREARRSGTLPTDAAIAEAVSRMGWPKVQLDHRHRTVKLTERDMSLDLGGIGKGFAVDEAMAALQQVGVKRCLIDLGGDIRAGHAPPKEHGWRVAISSGLDSSQRIILMLTGRAVATSGDAEQFLEINGMRYSHIIDPRTGMALTNRIAVTVIARDAATADALASAISVLGPDDGLALLESFPLSSARIVLQTSDGPRIVQSADFPASIDATVRQADRYVR